MLGETSSAFRDFRFASDLVNRGQANVHMADILNALVECHDFLDFLEYMERDARSGLIDNVEPLLQMLGEGIEYFLQRIDGVDAVSLGRSFSGFFDAAPTVASFADAVVSMQKNVKVCIAINGNVLKHACRL